MHAFVWGYLGGFPSQLAQKGLVLELVDLHAKGAAALDHFLFVVGSKAPCGKVTAGTGTFSYRDTREYSSTDVMTP